MQTALNQTSGWLEKIYQELAPTHGRRNGALRTAAAATLATYILLVLQTPLIAPGVYLIFLVSYDVPYLTFRRSVLELFSQCAGVAAALMLIELTGNDPMARVLGVAAFTFLSAFLLCACTVRSMAMNLGIFPILTLSLWEMHLPPEQLLHLSMWPIGTGALAVSCKVAIEYMFTRRDPHHALQSEMKARLEAMRQLFLCYAESASAAEARRKASTVYRLAFAGQVKMLLLLQEVRLRPVRKEERQAISPALISHVARLMDLGAAFGRQHPVEVDEAQRTKLKKCAARLAALQAPHIEDLDELEEIDRGKSSGLLGQIEQVIENMAVIARAADVELHEDPLEGLPRKQEQPWFRADAWTNPEYLTYAAKLSLSATLCYVIYNALAWPGISTATLTVLVVGLSTTGATNQKMLFRIVGAVIGGIVFGIGCIIFVYPFAGSALSFLISVALVSFIGAWVARSAHFGYVGLQIVFSFYLVAFQEYAPPLAGPGAHIMTMAHGFGAPMQLTPARDRLIGILLALLVMWAIFHRLQPERTVDKMRRGLARLLRVEADLLMLLSSTEGYEVAELREDAQAIVVEVRALAEAIPYELDQYVKRDLEISDGIQSAIGSAGSVFLYANAEWPRSRQTAGPSSVDTIHASISQGMRNLSKLLEGKEEANDLSELTTGFAAPGVEAASSETSKNVLSAFSQLQMQVLKIQADA